MAWFMIIGFFVLSWMASLCKMLVSSSSSKASFFSDGKIDAEKHVLLVVAHPDDESIFVTVQSLQGLHFVQDIELGLASFYLRSRSNIQQNAYYLRLRSQIRKISSSYFLLSLVDLSGNADGLGSTRKEELYLALSALKVPHHHVRVVDHPDLQDGFGNMWDSNLLAQIIEDLIHACSIDVIITFDYFGTSGHCNHRDVHVGVRKLLQNTKRSIEAWELISTNVLRKYSGPIDIWLSIFHARQCPNGSVQVFLNEHPIRSFIAMAQHRSQFVWFRKFFVSFSSYTYVNTLKRIKD